LRTNGTAHRFSHALIALRADSGAVALESPQSLGYIRAMNSRWRYYYYYFTDPRPVPGAGRVGRVR